VTIETVLSEKGGVRERKEMKEKAPSETRIPIASNRYDLTRNQKRRWRIQTAWARPSEGNRHRTPQKSFHWRGSRAQERQKKNISIADLERAKAQKRSGRGDQLKKERGVGS